MISPEERHELNLRMAKEVMGYPLSEYYPQDGEVIPCVLKARGVDELFLMDDLNSMTWDDRNRYQPCTDIRQALECIDRMRQRDGFKMHLRPDRDGWYVQENFTETLISVSFADLPATICKVIAAALDKGQVK